MPRKVRATREELLARYEGGESLGDIAAAYGVTKQAVFYALRRNAIARRSYSDASILALSQGKVEGHTTARLDESLFSRWSRPMAYLLGYIFTDGSLTSKGKYSQAVTISSVDREHLKKLAVLLGAGVLIGTHKQSKKGFSGSQDRFIHDLVFTRPRMVVDLRRLGLTERKSLTLEFPDVPEEYLRDFIRGCWDGDGSIYVGGKGGRQLVAKIGMGSRKFITGIRDRLMPLSLGKLIIYVREPDRKRGGKNPHYVLVIHGRYAVKFCEWLYADTPDALYLTRKRLVYEKFMAGRLTSEQETRLELTRGLLSAGNDGWTARRLAAVSGLPEGDVVECLEALYERGIAASLVVSESGQRVWFDVRTVQRRAKAGER